MSLSVLKELVKRIKSARRRGAHKQLQSFATSLSKRPVIPPDLEQLSKAHYEIGMGNWDEYTRLAQRANKHLMQSLQYLELSARNARDRCDRIGELCAEATIGGLVLPAAGQWQSGFALSGDTCHKLEMIAAAISTRAIDKQRALRFAANSYIHRVRMVIALKVDSDQNKKCISELLANLKKNSYYTAHADKYRNDILAAEIFLRE